MSVNGEFSHLRECVEAAAEEIAAGWGHSVPGLEGSAANPQVQQLAGRIAACDRAIAAVFRSVPVPTGLAERLHETLRAARVEAPPTVPSVPPVLLPRVSRRWLLAGAASLAAAAALLVAVFFGVSGWQRWSEAALLESAIALFDTEPRETVRTGGNPDDLPYSPQLRRPRDLQWRWFSGFGGRRGIAYDLALGGGTEATLYVVAGGFANVPFQPPLRPTFSTGNRYASAWRSGGLIYVLVVRGREGDYRQLISAVNRPLV